MYQLAILVKLEHWSVKGVGSEARHEALGELYDYLESTLDKLVEQYQGYCNDRLDLTIGEVSLGTDVSLAINTMILTLEKVKEPAWLVNKLQEIQGELNWYKYKLSLQ